MVGNTFSGKSHVFQVNYLVANIKTNSRLFLRYSIIPNILVNLCRNIYRSIPCCKLFEREMWDLFWHCVY